VIELLEVALDENENIKYLKSLSFWGDPEKANDIKEEQHMPWSI
jgi:DNA-directed RNA polymerase subunit F